MELQMVSGMASGRTRDAYHTPRPRPTACQNSTPNVGMLSDNCPACFLPGPLCLRSQGGGLGVKIPLHSSAFLHPPRLWNGRKVWLGGRALV